MFSWLNFGKPNQGGDAGRERNSQESEVDGFVMVEEREGSSSSRPPHLAAAPPPYQQVAAHAPLSNASPKPDSGASATPAAVSFEVRSPISDIPFSLAAPLQVCQQLERGGGAEVAGLLSAACSFQPSLYWYDFSLETQFLHDLDLSHRENQQNAHRERQLVL